MTTNELASFLRKLSDKIEEGRVELSQGDKSVVLRIPKNVDVEVEVEEETINGKTKQKLEIEIEFSPEKEDPLRVN